MKYRDKVRNKPTKQGSSHGGYDPKFEKEYICPNCLSTFSSFDYEYRQNCCGTSIQKMTKGHPITAARGDGDLAQAKKADDPTVSASPGIHAEVSERRGLRIQDTSLPIYGEDVDGSCELRSLQSHGSVRKLTAPCSTVKFTEVRATVDQAYRALAGALITLSENGVKK